MSSKPGGYDDFLSEIIGMTRAARAEAFKAANRELIDLQWEIGRMLFECREKGWDQKALLRRLEADLSADYPGTRILSAANLGRMLAFYEAYRKDQRLVELARKIGWGPNILIIEKCGDNVEREKYLRDAVEHGWSIEMLRTRLDGRTHGRAWKVAKTGLRARAAKAEKESKKRKTQKKLSRLNTKIDNKEIVAMVYDWRLRKLDRIAKKSRMTTEDAAIIGKKVKKAITAHYKEA